MRTVSVTPQRKGNNQLQAGQEDADFIAKIQYESNDEDQRLNYKPYQALEKYIGINKNNDILPSLKAP